MEGVVDTGNTAWVLSCCGMVLLMTPGLAFFYGGLVPGNNVVNTMMMSIISMGVVTVPWMLVGFSLSFGPGWFIGDFRYAGLTGLHGTVWPGTTLPALVFVAFQQMFAVIGAAIISGAIVERMRFSAFMVFIILWSVAVYAPICHWAWGQDGWMGQLGAKDFAGGMVVHETTAVSALVLAVMLGPRARRAEPDEKTLPHNVPFVILGASLLWFGWTGFNGGSSYAADAIAALAVINTWQAAGASLVVWTFLERWVNGRWSAVASVTGAIVGLVVITPAAGFVSPVGAVSMGVLGAILVFPSFQLNSKRIDDTLDCFPCHGVSGFVGAILTGAFDTEGGLLYGGGFRLIIVQAICAMATAVYACSVSLLIFVAISCVMRMRVSEETEVAGLDNKIHGEQAYGAHASRTADRDRGCTDGPRSPKSESEGEDGWRSNADESAP